MGGATGPRWDPVVHKGSEMSTNLSKGNVLLAGVTPAAAAVAVVGHMYAIDWVGKKLRDYVRQA